MVGVSPVRLPIDEVNIGSAYRMVPPDNKPSTEPILTQICVAVGVTGLQWVKHITALVTKLCILWLTNQLFYMSHCTIREHWGKGTDK